MQLKCNFRIQAQEREFQSKTVLPNLSSHLPKPLMVMGA